LRHDHRPIEGTANNNNNNNNNAQQQKKGKQ